MGEDSDGSRTTEVDVVWYGPVCAMGWVEGGVINSEKRGKA